MHLPPIKHKTDIDISPKTSYACELGLLLADFEYILNFLCIFICCIHTNALYSKNCNNPIFLFKIATSFIYHRTAFVFKKSYRNLKTYLQRDFMSIYVCDLNTLPPLSKGKNSLSIFLLYIRQSVIVIYLECFHFELFCIVGKTLLNYISISKGDFI